MAQAMVSTAEDPTPRVETPSPKAHPNKLMIEKSLEKAGQLCAAGRWQQARALYADAWSSSQKADPLLRAAAGLGCAHAALSEGSWPVVAGLQLDELLLDALEEARGVEVGRRSRAMEGQLLLLRSRALFDKPNKDAASLDAAVEARFAGLELLREAAVEELPWSTQQVGDALSALTGDDDKALSLDELSARLSALWPADVTEETGAAVSNLFEAFVSGGDAVALSSFLRHFLEIAARLDRPVDKEPCTTAPCSGGLTVEHSDLERELVKLVSQNGAGSWDAKAAQLQSRGSGFAATGKDLETLWTSLAPQLKRLVEKDDQMSCGHSCSSCPTRHDCQVHTALKDIEDL